jgi:hypothetical protein
MTKFRRNAGKPDTIVLFATRIKKFIASLGKLGLADVDDCNAIYEEHPKELFTRFMQARITRLGWKNDDN